MLDSEIKTYHSAEVSSASTNGGRIDLTNLVTSGVVNNVWPHVSRAERLAGSVLHRKLHVRAANDDDETLLNPIVWCERVIDADDYIVMFLGTAIDTQADIAGSERKYGYAAVDADISSGASSFYVRVKAAALASGTDAIIKDSDTLRLSDMATPDGTGNEEWLTVSGTPVVSDTTRLLVTVAETIANGYLVADSAFVVSYPALDDLACSVENFTVTAAGTGDYDDTTYPVICDNLGTIEDSVTLEFTDATHFTVTGSSGTSYGTGDTSTDFSPTNADASKPYFTLEAAGFSGTFAALDTIEFDIHPADFAYWLRRTVPAGSGSLANNKVTGVTAGESAT